MPSNNHFSGLPSLPAAHLGVDVEIRPVLADVVEGVLGIVLCGGLCPWGSGTTCASSSPSLRHEQRPRVRRHAGRQLLAGSGAKVSVVSLARGGGGGLAPLGGGCRPAAGRCRLACRESGKNRRCKLAGQAQRGRSHEGGRVAPTSPHAPLPHATPCTPCNPMHSSCNPMRHLLCLLYQPSHA